MLNTQKLLIELQSSGLPVDSINSNGNITSTRFLEKQEIDKINTIIAAHDPVSDSLPLTTDEKLDKLLTMLVTKELLTQQDVDKVNVVAV